MKTLKDRRNCLYAVVLASSSLLACTPPQSTLGGAQEQDSPAHSKQTDTTVVPETAPLEVVSSAPPRATPRGLHKTPSESPRRENSGIRVALEPVDRERYANIEANSVQRVAEHPVSTFSIDVDTGAYANMRRFLRAGQLPPSDAVRVEELINYFAYEYPAPAGREAPFRVTTSVAPAPWAAGRHLLRVGIKGYELAPASLPPANLVFLIDVSGSMNAPGKLALLKPALKVLTRRLRARDSVAIVVYAGASGVVLKPTAGNNTAAIESALERLSAGGGTNGAAGIRLAYQLARQAFKPEGVNRILLATDGDFNVGTTNLAALKDLVRRERASGISLTTLGFGRGNYNDELMEQLADLGNGNHAYIDSLQEANKVLGQQMAGTLATIAKDVKVQIEFNPKAVSEYRLVGYENRRLEREDFRNDKVDAGEIGAGHSVTALYELVLVGAGTERVSPLRYGSSPNPNPNSTPSSNLGELAFLKIRYKRPGEQTSELLTYPLQRESVLASLDNADADFRFAAAVAGFGQWLRGGTNLESFGPQDVVALARDSRGSDRFGYRGEFLQLVSLAESLK